MSGSTDRLADTSDVNLMIKDLVNARVWHKIYDYGHITFLMGITMEHMKDVVEILKNDIYWYYIIYIDILKLKNKYFYKN